MGALAACLAFLLMGCAFIPQLGIENDEALFASGIFKPYSVSFVMKLTHARIPLMLMSYLGALKSLLFRFVFQWFGVSIVTTRLPALLAGAASIWLFFLLLDRVAGRRAALFGSVLLASDSLYLLTSVYDWGPVAFQHLLIVGGMLLLVQFYQQGSLWRLGWGSFLMGLAVWDKALAIWLLSGIGIALLAVIPRQIFRRIRLSTAGVAVLGFTLGALPLIIYNVKEPLVTFRGNAAWSTSDLPGKVHLLKVTFDGEGLLGWLNCEDWHDSQPAPPSGIVERVSAQISSIAGQRRHSLGLYAFFAAILLLPFARGAALRAILGGLLAMAVGWCEMAMTANAGGSVHHAILLWPVPQWIIAISFAAASRRLGKSGIPVLATLLIVLATSNLLVTNEYHRQIARNGGTKFWTDAIYNLSAYLKAKPANTIYCVDWGMIDSLRLLSRGRLTLAMGNDLAKPPANDIDRTYRHEALIHPENLFLSHTKDFEFFTGVSDEVVAWAASRGYRREIVSVISDSRQRPVYEVYRLVRQ
jgi:hypothetical protein